MSEVLKARSAVGVATRSGDPDKIADARRDLAAAKLHAYVEKVVNEAPPLTTEQRTRLTSLFAPARGGSA